MFVVVLTTLAVAQYIASNGTVINVWRMKKNVDGSDRGPVTGRYSENPREIQPGWAVSGPRFEPVVSCIRSRCVTNSTMTFIFRLKINQQFVICQIPGVQSAG
jgi:hypothetical protein